MSRATAAVLPTSKALPAATVLRAESGEVVDLDAARWHGDATTDECVLLEEVDGPVLDIGCGPGRLVVALARRGVPALGVDASPSAVALARQRGAAALERDVFERLPAEGRWATALLFDGNIGIGGDPVTLLRRCRELVVPGGRVVAEVDPPGRGLRSLTAWLERDGRRSPRFGWAVVGADAIAQVARFAGLHVRAMVVTATGRWFCHIESA
jgi:SAM-dependent methyltransferase